MIHSRDGHFSDGGGKRKCLRVEIAVHVKDAREVFINPQLSATACLKAQWVQFQNTVDVRTDKCVLKREVVCSEYRKGMELCHSRLK